MLQLRLTIKLDIGIFLMKNLPNRYYRIIIGAIYIFLMFSITPSQAKNDFSEEWSKKDKAILLKGMGYFIFECGRDGLNFIVYSRDKPDFPSAEVPLFGLSSKLIGDNQTLEFTSVYRGEVDINNNLYHIYLVIGAFDTENYAPVTNMFTYLSNSLIDKHDFVFFANVKGKKTPIAVFSPTSVATWPCD